VCGYRSGGASRPPPNPSHKGEGKQSGPRRSSRHYAWMPPSSRRGPIWHLADNEGGRTGVLILRTARFLLEMLVGLRRVLPPGDRGMHLGFFDRSQSGAGGAGCPTSWSTRSRGSRLPRNRDVGQHRAALGAGAGFPARQLAGMDEGAWSASSDEKSLGVAAHHVDHGGAGAAERNMQKIHLGGELEQLAGRDAGS